MSNIFEVSKRVYNMIISCKLCMNLLLIVFVEHINLGFL